MNLLELLRQRFAAALTGMVDDVEPLLDMVKPSGDAKFGDYQANCAMPLQKQLGQASREIAQTIVERLDVDDLCQPPEIAGPGFINLRFRDDWLTEQLVAAVSDRKRLGVARVDPPRTIIIDYSSPNVAKPMHVGHIRSTVIGDSLYRLLTFLGHRVISDNHIGDWGAQFGMIIYGYKHLLDAEAYADQPVHELGRLYRAVSALVDYHDTKTRALPELETKIAAERAAVQAAQTEAPTGDAKTDKKAAKELRRAEARLAEMQSDAQAMADKIAAIDDNPEQAALAAQHSDIGQAVLAETAKLHAGDEENLALWREFLPPCLEEINRTYRRLKVRFDHTLGESFYHDRLAGVVDDLLEKGIATESDGAICVFLDGQAAPLIVRKQDGAFLYATTDLATIAYRLEQFQPDAILYVVDHRQSLHFEQLFGTVAKLGYDALELAHVSFGTVMGEDKRPYRTRSGDTVGLWGLLDEAVERAHRVVSEKDDGKKGGPELSDPERQQVAEVVGIGALKYADLTQNRTSDYVFSYDKMLAMNGNTATYMQFATARVQSIFAKGGVDLTDLRTRANQLALVEPTERALGLKLIQYEEALASAAAEYRPNLLTGYLFELAGCYSDFYENCPVLKAEDEATRTRRLLLCDLTARTLTQGLSLLGIRVVEKM
jgi:arginyl-tRNA synthetase